MLKFSILFAVSAAAFASVSNAEAKDLHVQCTFNSDSDMLINLTVVGGLLKRASFCNMDWSFVGPDESVTNTSADQSFGFSTRYQVKDVLENPQLKTLDVDNVVLAGQDGTARLRDISGYGTADYHCQVLQ